MNFTAISHMDQVLEKALLPGAEDALEKTDEVPAGFAEPRERPGVVIRQ